MCNKCKVEYLINVCNICKYSTCRWCNNDGEYKKQKQFLTINKFEK